MVDKNGYGPSWLPFKFPNFWGNKPADRHDRGYSIGGNEFRRWMCDIKFLDDMLRASIVNNSLTKKVSLCTLAVCYYIAVVFFGWISFNYGGETKDV